MKKILIMFWLLLILSACNSNETDIVCTDGFELDQYGQCMLFCNDGLEPVDGECKIVTPVCSSDEILNEETNACEIKPLICEEPLVEDNGSCIDPNVVLDFSEMNQGFKDVFDIYDISNDEIIDLSEVDNIYDLDLSNLMLSDIRFLSYFKDLESLNIENNSIVDISSLNGLENLTELNAGTNLIENICLFTNTNLVSLDLNNNLITDIDCLGGFDQISILDVSNNEIRFIEKLNVFPNARDINLSHNKIIGISGMEHLFLLESLDVSYNDIILNYTFENLSDSTNLVYLNASYNDMSLVTSFNSITSLEEINIDGNNVSVISSLKDLVNLKVFSSKGQSIYDIAIIEKWINLEEIYLEGRYIVSLEPLFKVPKLKTIDVSDISLSYNNVNNIIELHSKDINVISGINLDTNGYPLLISKQETVYVYVGEDRTLTDLGVVAYDIEDGSLEFNITSNLNNTSLLSVGNYVLDLSVTDEDGNTSFKSISLVVRDRISMSNLVVFVVFNDYTYYSAPNTYEEYFEIFNGDTNSLKDYYLEISNGEYIIESLFTHEELYFFESEHDRAYYQLKSPSNPEGYNSVAEQKERERELLRDIAIEIEANNYIDEDVNLDADEDGVIDGITLLFAGYTDEWNQLLWPHTYFLDAKDVDGNFTADSPTINNKYVYKYNVQFMGHSLGEDTLYLGVIAHEILHIIGAPDFYHYYQDFNISPIGEWGLMDISVATPKHPLQYTKEQYGGFSTDPIYVSEDGLYTLNRTTLTEDNVIVIDLDNSNEYIYIEYRTQVGDYEIEIPIEGTIVYRVDKDYFGNYFGMYDENYNSLDEVFIFREALFIEEYLDEGKYVISDSGDIDKAALNYGFDDTMGVGTKIPMFYSDGTEIMIQIIIAEQNEDQVKIQIDFLE